MATRKSSEPTPTPGGDSPQEIRARLAEAQRKAMFVQSRIAEHDAREERRMFELSRRASSNMLTMADLGGMGSQPLSRADVMLPGMSPSQQFLTEQFPTSHDNAVMEELHSPRNRKQVLKETVQHRPSRPAPAWAVKKYLGETRGGGTVSVWKVTNNTSGIAFDKLFKIESVAIRIASFLNESNNLSDPRIVGVIRDYEKRDRLLKEARLLEREEPQIKVMKASRLRALRAEITSLDYKLGI